MPEYRSLFNDLIRFETELWAAIDARLRADVGLPLSRFEPMQIIRDTPACRVYDISTALVIGMSGASKIVDRMEALGHCTRTPNPDDRRSSHLKLTPGGQDLLERAEPLFDEELRRRIGAATTTRSLDQFAATLGKLRLANSRDFIEPARLTSRTG